LARVGFVKGLNQAQTFFQTSNPVAFVQSFQGRGEWLSGAVHGGWNGRDKPEMGAIIGHDRSIIAQISKISSKSQTFRSKFHPFKVLGGVSTVSQPRAAHHGLTLNFFSGDF
jgi:hypothetical protein